ncbi:MAG: helix-turn-helix domain-containing protein [Lachnospiraceae bacterium]|nr:helix-turn-helix domain-containing protein [Lachnospiraceae bacterium]
MSMQSTVKSEEDRVGRTRWMVSNATRKDLDDMLDRVPVRTSSVRELLLARLGEKNMSVDVMAELAGMSRATGFKILSGKQRAERDMLLRIAFVLEFDFEETAQLLKSGCKAALTADSKRDVAIIFGLENHLTLGDMDDLLEEYGLAPLVPVK